MIAADPSPTISAKPRSHDLQQSKCALTIFNCGVTPLVVAAVPRYAGVMRYPDGGGLTVQERARREQVRLAVLS